METPEIGLVVCNSGASNTGQLTGLVALEVVRKLGSDRVGICSLPALANKIPSHARQEDWVPHHCRRLSQRVFKKNIGCAGDQIRQVPESGV
ncbi:MAG: hypothetical protein QXR44_06090 [Thermoproteota archaeon]